MDCSAPKIENGSIERPSMVELALKFASVLFLCLIATWTISFFWPAITVLGAKLFRIPTRYNLILTAEAWRACHPVDDSHHARILGKYAFNYGSRRR
jgi:hypothetical protein